MPQQVEKDEESPENIGEAATKDRCPFAEISEF
jgi:hypothetical protein